MSYWPFRWKWLKFNKKVNMTCKLIHRFVQGDYPHWLIPLQTIGDNIRLILYPSRDYIREQGQSEAPKPGTIYKQNLRNSSNLITFRKKLKEHLLDYQWHQAYNCKIKERKLMSYDVTILFDILILYYILCILYYFYFFTINVRCHYTCKKRNYCI